MTHTTALGSLIETPSLVQGIELMAEIKAANADAHYFRLVLPAELKHCPQNYLTFPLEFRVLNKVMALQSCAALQYVGGIRKRRRRLILQNSICDEFHISRHTKTQGLKDFKRLGVIAVLPRSGDSDLITLI